MDEDMYGGGGNYRNQGRGGNPNNQQQHYYNQPTGMENRRGGAQGGGYPKGPGMQPNPQQGAGAQYGHGQYTQGMPQQYQQTGPMRGNLRGQPQVPRGGNNPNTGGGHYGYYNQDPGNQMSDGGMGYQPPAQNQRGGYSGNPIGNQRPGIQQGVTPSQPAQNQRMYNNPANQQQMGGPQGHQNMPLAGHHHQQGAMGQIHPGQSRNMNANMQAAAVLGRIVNVGRLGGMTGDFDFDLHALKRIDYIGVTFRTRSAQEVRDIVAAMRADLMPAVESGRLALPIDRTYPFEEADAAFAHMRANAHFGKIVLTL